jgi:anti-sigma factor (TIGR02949 family)
MTPIDCREALRRIAAYLDRELDPSERAELEEHLERCRSCFSRAEFERKLKDRVREELGAERVPAELEGRIRLLIRGLPEAP